jgi:hypothetical protein
LSFVGRICSKLNVLDARQASSDGHSAEQMARVLHPAWDCPVGDRRRARTRLNGMRLIYLLLAATLAAAPAGAQEGAASSQADEKPHYDLPVSLDKIKEGLEQQPSQLTLRSLDERPTFRVQILERQKLDELLATLDFKTTRAPAGGLYWQDVQRQMWPSVDNPLNQPYAAFSQSELLTVLIENLAGHYLGGKALNAVSNAERSHAEAAAREEVMQAIREYCNAQPNGGAGIQICSTSSAIR